MPAPPRCSQAGAIPGQSHTPHPQDHAPSEADASRAGLPQDPLTRAVVGTQEPPTPGLVSWEVGSHGQMSRAPALPGGQNSGLQGPPSALGPGQGIVPLAGGRPGLEPRTGIKPILSRDSGWGWGWVGIKHPGALHRPPCPSAGTQRPPTCGAPPTCSPGSFGGPPTAAP